MWDAVFLYLAIYIVPVPLFLNPLLQDTIKTKAFFNPYFTFLTLTASLVVAQDFRDFRVANLPTPEFELADSTCNCCVSSPVRQAPCPVEVVIVLNSAACVKEYWKKMLHRTTRMIDQIYAEHPPSEDGNHQGARVGVIKYNKLLT